MKNHSKAVHTPAGTQVTVDEMEEMVFQEQDLGGGHMVTDQKAGVYRYTDAGGVHYVAPIEPEFPVDSTSYTLPDGRTVIGKDAYEAEVVKAVFGS